MNMSLVSHMIEFGQLGLVDDNVTVHYDTVAYDDQAELKKNTDDLITQFNTSSPNISFAKPSVSKGLPPASLHSFLKLRNTTAVLLTDFDSQYANK